jgi:DNA-binding Lrp family transcriptional regulator
MIAVDSQSTRCSTARIVSSWASSNRSGRGGAELLIGDHLVLPVYGDPSAVILTIEHSRGLISAQVTPAQLGILRTVSGFAEGEVSNMKPAERLDEIDAELLLALTAQPRATVLALSEQVGLSRNTVQARLAKLEQRAALMSFERRIDPAALGYPLTAFITTQVTQRRLADVADALAEIPEVIEVHGISGSTDLLVRVAAADADDLYRIAGQVLASPGVERTSTSLVMRELVDYRVTPLLHRIAGREPAQEVTAPSAADPT